MIQVSTIDELAKAFAEVHRSGASQVVWGYCRVSTDKQEDGQSFEVQEQAIVESVGNALVVMIRETGSAAKPCLAVRMPGQPANTPVEAQPRPLFTTLLAHLIGGDRSGDTLLVWKLDRMSRILHEQEFILDLLNRSRIEVGSTSQTEQDMLGSDKADPSRLMVRQIMGAVAQYERTLIRLRLESGSRMKASKGGWLGGGIPMGYRHRAADGDLEIDPQVADVVRRVFYMRDVQLLSYGQIVRELREAGHQGWHAMKVSRIVRNRRLYAGVYVDPYGTEHPRPDLRILPASWNDSGIPLET